MGKQKQKQKLNKAKQSQLIPPPPLSTLSSFQSQIRHHREARWLSRRHAARGAFLFSLRCGHLSLCQHKLAGTCRGHAAVIRCVCVICQSQFSWADCSHCCCCYCFFFVLFFAEIKLHPGASSSNDEHSNFIGGKLKIVDPLCSVPPLYSSSCSLACRSRGGGTQ